MRKKYIAGSSKCTPKSLSVILIQKLTIVKVVFRLVKKSSFYKGRFSKNSKELLKHLVSNTLSSVKRIKPFPFFSYYNTTPHSEFKERLNHSLGMLL